LRISGFLKRIEAGRQESRDWWFSVNASNSRTLPSSGGYPTKRPKKPNTADEYFAGQTGKEGGQAPRGNRFRENSTYFGLGTGPHFPLLFTLQVLNFQAKENIG